MSDFEYEPIPGLPDDLPAGEHILWQGRPQWWSLTRRALHARKVAIYFAVVGLWMGGYAFATGQGLGLAAGELASQLAIGASAVAVLSLLGWLMSRSTIYTITNRRVVARIGVALPITVNLPFVQVESADMKRHKDGTGDIALTFNSEEKVSYLLFWPHVRPWTFDRPRPSLRSVPDVDHVAGLLADALAGSQGRRGAANDPEAARETATADSAAATG